MLFIDSSESLGCAIECFIPTRFVEFAVLAANKWGCQAVGMVHKVEGELPLDAEGALVCGSVHRRVDADDPILLGQEINRAADAAVGTDGAGFLDFAR